MHKKKDYPLFVVLVTMLIIFILVAVFGVSCAIKSEKESKNEGSITIHTNQGEVLGYYGNVKINKSGSSGEQADVELFNSWLVGEAKEDAKTGEVEPLVIDIPEPTQKGTVTVYDKDKEIVYNYQGDFIKIVNDGKDGEPIEIEINIPYDKDSCFQEGETDGQ